MIVQLNLFDEAQFSAKDFEPAHQEPDKTRDLGAHQGEVINPCINCTLRGLCDDDDCGAHGYPIDTGSTRFKNLGEYIDFIKHYDWL